MAIKVVKILRSENAHYRERNNLSSKRTSFTNTACRKWMERNQPEVMRAIEAKAEELWPLERVVRHNAHNDYSFIEKLEKAK